MKFGLSEACERSFQILKDKLTFAPMWSLPEGTRASLCIMMHPEWLRVCDYAKWESNSLCL